MAVKKIQNLFFAVLFFVVGVVCGYFLNDYSKTKTYELSTWERIPAARGHFVEK